LNEAIALGHAIVVAEGEKDVDALWRIGIPATCNAHGAHDPTKNQLPKWKAAHSEQLHGADIVVIPDHDAPGYAHCEAACRLSLGIAKRVRRLALAIKRLRRSHSSRARAAPSN
jgi:DNA primase